MLVGAGSIPERYWGSRLVVGRSLRTNVRGAARPAAHSHSISQPCCMPCAGARLAGWPARQGMHRLTGC